MKMEVEESPLQAILMDTRTPSIAFGWSTAPRRPPNSFSRSSQQKVPMTRLP